jgi:hypothetical protein
MIQRTFLACGSMFAVLLVCNGGLLSAPISANRLITYEDNARTVYETFSGDNMTGAIVRPRRLLLFQSNNVMFGEEVGHAVHDCSTSQYRCIFVWGRVFAVPRTRLSSMATYLVAGASLKVENCLRGDAAVCQVALISADCELLSGDGCKEAIGGQEKSSDSGPILYFVYNEDFGVTAFGVTQHPAKTKEEKLNIASQMILQGVRGLLADTH